MLRWAVKEYDGPVAVRYPRGGDGQYQDSDFAENKGIQIHKDGEDIAIITYGALTNEVLAAAVQLSQKGVNAKIIRLLTLAPLPVDEIAAALGMCGKVLIVEEATAGSGIHEALAWELKKRLPDLQTASVDLGSHFVSHGSLKQLYQIYGLDSESIANTALEVLDHENQKAP